MKKKKLFGLLPAALFLLGASLLFASGERDSVRSGEYRYGEEKIRTLKAQLAFVESRGSLPDEGEEELLRFFAPEGVAGHFRLAYFVSGDRKLALYHFRPAREEAVGFVYLFHGYLDHTLSNIRLISFLLDQGYEVAGFDLPGHGLSEGAPVDIEDFSEYADAMEDFLALTLGGDENDCFILAHSTGCSMVLEYLKTRDSQFKKIIMASPLVYTAGWRFTALGITLAEPFSDHIFRRFGGSSQDKDYSDFVENRDPFQSRELPFSWVRAYLNWNREMRSQPVREDLAFHILQGDRDSVVDYRMNIPFLTERYPLSRVIIYEDAMHSLFNERKSLRETVFQDILMILRS